MSRWASRASLLNKVLITLPSISEFFCVHFAAHMFLNGFGFFLFVNWFLNVSRVWVFFSTNLSNVFLNVPKSFLSYFILLGNTYFR